VERRALSAEKAFYGELQALYTAQLSVLTAQNSVYDKEIDLRELRVQGYGAGSAKMRTALLEAEDARRQVREEERLFARKMASFGRKCGTEISVLPESVGATAPGRPDPSMSTPPPIGRDVESAKWSHEIGALSRSAEGGVELSATGVVSVRDGETTVGAGAALSFGGVKISAGVEGDALTFGATVAVNEARFAALDKKERVLDARLEVLAIEAAEEAWAETVKAREDEGRDLAWEQGQREAQRVLAEQLRTEMRGWFNRGDITESEWRKADTDAVKAALQCVLTSIKIVVHIIEGKLL
jgi:hypothetical protein